MKYGVSKNLQAMTARGRWRVWALASGISAISGLSGAQAPEPRRPGPRIAAAGGAALARAEEILGASLAAAGGGLSEEGASALARTGFSSQAAPAAVVSAAEGAAAQSPRSPRARPQVPSLSAGWVFAAKGDEDEKPPAPSWDRVGTMWAGSAGFIGAAIGMAVAGPIGAVVGFLVGFFVGALLWRLFG